MPRTRQRLKTSLETLTRVLDAVHWPDISKGDADAWLYFYEDFLEVYDNALRKLTGSYYTPPEVVEAMVRLVDEFFAAPASRKRPGLRRRPVTLADPAVARALSCWACCAALPSGSRPTKAPVRLPRRLTPP